MWLAQFGVAVIFIGVFTRLVKWILRKSLRQPFPLALPHAASFVAATLLYGLLGADGPFANGIQGLLRIIPIYAIAQGLWFMIDYKKSKKEVSSSI